MPGNGNEYEKPRPGDALDIPAKLWGEMIDVVLKDKRGQGAIMAGAIANTFDGSIIQVKNTTGSNLPRLSVLGFGNAVIAHSDNADAFQERVIVEGTTPSLPRDAGRWLITLQPLATNEIGYGCINGACPVQVDIQSSTDTSAEAVDSDNAKLKSGGSGAPIIYKESGTGVKWAVVRVGNNGGGVDIYQAGVLVLSKAPFINMSTSRGTSNLFEFFAETIGGVVGIGMRVKAASDYQVAQQVSGNALWDYVRAH